MWLCLSWCLSELDDWRLLIYEAGLCEVIYELGSLTCDLVTFIFHVILITISHPMLVVNVFLDWLGLEGGFIDGALWNVVSYVELFYSKVKHCWVRHYFYSEYLFPFL